MTEHRDLASSLPAIAAQLEQRRKESAKTIFNRPNEPDDPACMTAAFALHGGFLGPWKDA